MAVRDPEALQMAGDIRGTSAAPDPGAEQLAAWLAARVGRESSELYGLSRIVAVAALACEATRVLRDIEDACEASRQLDELLSQHCKSRRQWTEVDPTGGLALGAVLSDVALQLQEAAERLGDAPGAAGALSQGRLE